MVKTDDKCPVCGSRNIGEGKLSDTYMYATGRFFSASAMLAQVCGDCGAVFNLRVAKPEKFSRREKD